MKYLSWGEKLFFILKLPFRRQLEVYKKFGLYNRQKTREVSLFYTSPCLNDCVFCKRKEGRWPGTGPIMRQLDENRRLGIEKLNLVANEPLLHPDILAILDYARACGFKRFGALTSGELFASWPLTKKLIARGLETVSIPLYGLRREHDAAVRSPGSFKKVIAGLKNLEREKTAEVYIHSMVLRQNLGRFRDFLNFLDAGIKYPLAIVPLRPKDTALAYKDLMPSYTEIVKVLKGSGRNFIDYPLCILRELSPSVFRGISSCRTQKERIYYHTDKKHISKSTFFYSKLVPNPPLPACRACSVLSFCPGVLPEYARHYGASEFKPL
ncbi:MAG TPA: hypothetical protein DCZ92_04095 [Elusimicrobia bacterium]|nr:MAG: hypothetical protein A2016_10230 [Elusimicrobia bacterium GWF2_62_30]HBA59998.1 hypothetical protein [Elusimicrobiota bacterium]